MRHFEFELQLPDGRISAATATGFTWPDAFSRACQRTERRCGIEPNSGIVCLAYRSTRRPESPQAARAA